MKSDFLCVMLEVFLIAGAVALLFKTMQHVTVTYINEKVETEVAEKFSQFSTEKFKDEKGNEYLYINPDDPQGMDLPDSFRGMR